MTRLPANDGVFAVVRRTEKRCYFSGRKLPTNNRGHRLGGLPLRHSPKKLSFFRVDIENKGLGLSVWYKRVVQMVLMTARPFKHPATGVYYYRRGVPEELRPLVGRREEKVSLGTKDLTEAKRLHAVKAAEVEARWANLLKPPQSLSEREAYLAATGHFEAYLSVHSHNPSQAPWQPLIGDMLWRTVSWDELVTKVTSPDYLSTPDAAAVERARYEAHCLTEADRYLAERGLRVDEQGRSNLAKAIGAALQRAALALRDVSTSRWAFPVAAPRLIFPGAGDSTVSRWKWRIPSSVTFSSLVAGWTKEKQPTAKTAYSWTRVVDDLQNFLGYDDAQRMTSDDLVRWKASLIERELSTKTIRDGKIAPVRAILQWGLDNRHISANVAERLTVKVKIKPGSKKRGFTEEEAKLVLRTAALEKVSFRCGGCLGSAPTRVRAFLRSVN